jgi:hypothetical protein
VKADITVNDFFASGVRGVAKRIPSVATWDRRRYFFWTGGPVAFLGKGPWKERSLGCRQK